MMEISSSQWVGGWVGVRERERERERDLSNYKLLMDKPSETHVVVTNGLFGLGRGGE